jgi:KDO2-lipid IV(A) lauroyltransferase
LRILLASLSFLLGLLTLSAARWLGGAFGALAALCSSRKREIRDRIMQSLQVDTREADRILRTMYRYLGMNGVELLRMPRMSEEEMRKGIRFEGRENMDACPEGYLAAVAHTGNWEWMLASASPILGCEMHTVVKSLKPASLNTWVTEARSRWGTRILDRRGSVRELIKILRAGKPIGFVIDQNAKRNWGVFVDFFGTPACTTDGLASLAAMTHKPILPVFCRRDPVTLDLVVEVGEEIEGPKDRSAAEIERVTAAATQRLEAFIRRYPEQWIWMHRRWRTQPEPETAQAS